MNGKEIAESAVRVLDDKRAHDIRMYRMVPDRSIVDYAVIATGNSNTQVRAFSGELEEKLREQGAVLDHVEGHDGGIWVLMDYSTVAIHLFTRDAREFYNLDRLWSDAEPIDITALLEDNTAENGKKDEAKQ